MRKAVYRYHNGQDHFFTIDKSELGDGRGGYRYEGIGWYLEDAPLDDTYKPLSRWYNPGNGDHYYTADPNERPPGYNLENPAMGYCRMTPGGFSSVPLERWYNGVDHFYTIDTSKENLDGWTKELVQCYVWNTGELEGEHARRPEEPVR